MTEMIGRIVEALVWMLFIGFLWGLSSYFSIPTSKKEKVVQGSILGAAMLVGAAMLLFA